ncbi:g10027 [Coccomyxa elongata]
MELSLKFVGDGEYEGIVGGGVLIPGTEEGAGFGLEEGLDLSPDLWSDGGCVGHAVVGKEELECFMRVGKAEGMEVKVSAVDMKRVEEERWSIRGGYAMNGKSTMHKMIMGERPEGVPTEYVIDHKDRDKRNNSWENLRYKKEREAARVVAREAIREWGEWAVESDLLFGEGLLTEEEREEILQEVCSESVRIEEKERELPRGVKKRGGKNGEKIKYVVWCGKSYLGTFGRAEEAGAVYEAYVKGEEERAWNKHR